jgi:hypothetical protein
VLYSEANFGLFSSIEESIGGSIFVVVVVVEVGDWKTRLRFVFDAAE